MKNIVLCITGIMLFCAVSGQVNTDIDKVFNLKWKADIGITTYRSNMICNDGKLYIGSNGEDRNFDNDKKDGVYIIDSDKGEIITHILPDILGDNDVNGVVVNKNRIYFGNDNYHFYCYDTDGKELWRYKTEYDVESCPVLANINEDSEPDVIFTVEGKGVVALDGVTGKKIWKFEKVKRHRGYNGSPSIIDLNSDGIDDVLIGGEGTPSSTRSIGFKAAFYGDYFYAIDGSNGFLLWEQEVGSKIHASPLVIKQGKDICIVFASCYGSIQFYSKEGYFRKAVGTNVGLFSSPVISSPDGYLAIGQSWFAESDRYYVIPVADQYFNENDGGYEVLEETAKYMAEFNTGRISATAVFADMLGKGKPQFAFVTEKGEFIITAEKGALLQRLKLPAGAEATPMVKDIDGDGYLEILIACLDGYLYCYDTKSKGKVIWGQFRGDDRNSGVITF